ncbi:MAG: hypothetical protein M0P12_11790 [Paludibacteraceae bacterium]|nr:hypothetical protein [Paludibacteraceae bacterium]
MDEKEIPVELDESIEDELEDEKTGFENEKPNPIRFIPMLLLFILFGFIITDFYVRDALNGKITDNINELGLNYTAYIPSLENTDTLKIAAITDSLYAQRKIKRVIIPDSSLYSTLGSRLALPDSVIHLNINFSNAIKEQQQSDSILIIASKENCERVIYNARKENNIKGFYIKENESAFISFFKDKYRHLTLIVE